MLMRGLLEQSFESEPRITAAPSPTESLLCGESPESLWPQEIRKNEVIRNESALRMTAISGLEKIFSCVPQADIDVEQMVSSGLVDESVVIEMYNSMIRFFEIDSYNSRLILYFPFELIPHLSWQGASGELQDVAEKFRQKFKSCWQNILWVNDVRENFIEGDVLEPEMRTSPLERVPKAAHLIPFLVSRDIVSISELEDLIHKNTGTVLQKTVAETLPVLVDLNLLSSEKMNEILALDGLELQKKKPVSVSEPQMTAARAKWLETKNEPVRAPKYSERQLEMNFIEVQKNLGTDIESLKHASELILNDPELSRFFYPVSILFGSKLKGYGSFSADTDVAIFVRNGVSIDERASLKDKLRQVFPPEKFKDGVVEFWLEERGDQLSVIDFSDSDKNLADSTWSHVLFEGVWVGDRAALEELHQNLLSGYLYSRGKTIQGADARRIWLEEMERDTLQYRLMHKGYKRIFSKQGGIATEHADFIDGESVFYDSGYRRLALKLFLRKVFLPQLKK